LCEDRPRKLQDVRLGSEMFSMRKLNAGTLTVPFVLFAVCTTFQNCDGGFSYDPSSAQLSSLGSPDMTGVFGIVAYSPGGTAPLDSNSTMDTGFDYEIRATGASTSSALLTFSLNDTSTTASCVLSVVGDTMKRSIRCSSAGVVKIDLKAIWPDATVSMVSMTKTVGVFTAPPPTTTNGNVVAFRIRAGTGSSPWNTAADPIRVFVGQTLQVSNDDTVAHQIHANGAPFPHQNGNQAPNSTVNLVVVNAHAATATDTYEHNAGPSASIFIESIDGAAQYARSTGPGACAGCHGANVATSQKRGASFSTIKNAIATVGNMRGISLTDQELRAIAYVLNK
jgi:hypothetical protein